MTITDEMAFMSRSGIRKTPYGEHRWWTDDCGCRFDVVNNCRLQTKWCQAHRTIEREPPMKDEMRTLIAHAGLDVQHRCAGCGVLLTAYGREESNAWSCTDCALPGKTVATKYQAKEAD